MNQDNYHPKTYQLSKDFYRYETKQGLIYSENQKSTNLDSLQGFCRVYFKTGTILDGIFQKGRTDKATYYGNYTKGWLKAKWDLEKKIYDEGYQYTEKGECIYKGYFYKNTRTGEGQQWFGQDSFKGKWENGLRQGYFIQKTKNNKLQSRGKYVNHQKVGIWKYYYEDQVHEKIFTIQKQQQPIKKAQSLIKEPMQKQKTVTLPQKSTNQQRQVISISKFYQKQPNRNNNNICSLFCSLFCCPSKKVNIIATHKTPMYSSSQNIINKKLNKSQQNKEIRIINLQQITIKQSVVSKNSQFINQQIVSYIDPFEISTHKSLMTQTSYENLLNENKMIDDSVLEAWSIILQFYLFSKMNDRVIILPICLMKDYAGRDLKNRNYKVIKYYTKQFNKCFSLLSLIGDNNHKKILIPIIKNIHYILAVIEIKRGQKLKCKIYDSLKLNYGVIKQPHKNSYWLAIRDYLKDYINQQNNNVVSELIQQINSMQLSFEQCPSQQDNVSCGAFVSIFMYYFSINKQNQLNKLTISKQRIQKFRTQIFYKILKNKIIDYEEIDNVQKLFSKNISIKK